MDQNQSSAFPKNFSEKDLKTLLQSDAGKQLLTLLNKDGGAALRQAAAAISSGQYQKAYETIAPMMENKEAATLIDQLNKQRNG